MRRKKESEDIQEASAIVESSDSPQVATEKVRSGVFGLISIVASIVLVLVALFNPFHNNGQFHFSSNTDIKINLKLTSQDFLVFSNKNVCDGTGNVQGIKTSTAYAVGSKLNTSIAIGTGQLNDQGQCEYEITIPTPDGFTGGIVNFSFKFPFGKSREFPIDIGNSAPYKTALINIPLD